MNSFEQELDELFVLKARYLESRDPDLFEELQRRLAPLVNKFIPVAASDLVSVEKNGVRVEAPPGPKSYTARDVFGQAVKRCVHSNTIDVDLALTGQVVARLCLDCDEKFDLPGEFVIISSYE